MRFNSYFISTDRDLLIMSQEECSRKGKKINNKKYVPVGSRVSLQNKKISSHQQKHTSNCIPDVHKLKLKENHHKLK